MNYTITLQLFYSQLIGKVFFSQILRISMLRLRFNSIFLRQSTRWYLMSPDNQHRFTVSQQNSKSMLTGEDFFLYIFLADLSVLATPSLMSDVAHSVFLRDVWIRTQRADLSSRCAATHFFQHKTLINYNDLSLHPSRKLLHFNFLFTFQYI